MPEITREAKEAFVAELDEIIERIYSLTARIDDSPSQRNRINLKAAMWSVSGIRDGYAGRNGIKTPSPIDGIRGI